MTRRELQQIAITAAIAASASSLVTMAISWAFKRAAEVKERELSEEERRAREEQEMIEEAERWILAGMGSRW